MVIGGGRRPQVVRLGKLALIATQPPDLAGEPGQPDLQGEDAKRVGCRTTRGHPGEQTTEDSRHDALSTSPPPGHDFEPNRCSSRAGAIAGSTVKAWP